MTRSCPVCDHCFSDVSRYSEISIQCYLRTEEPKRGGDGIADDMGNDIFMGGVRFTPDFEESSPSEQWYDFVGGPGRIQIGVAFKQSSGHSLTIDDFELITVIGKGSFGKVMQVRKRDTSRIYALKTIRKANIASRPGEITHILAERTVLALVNNPFIVPLKYSFQTPDKLYLVMSFGEWRTMRPGVESCHRSLLLLMIRAVQSMG